MDEQTQQNPQINMQDKPYNADPNLEAAIAYLIPFVAGVFILLMEKNNKFVRFHAMQSIVFWLAVAAFSFVFQFFTVALLFVAAPLVALFAPLFGVSVFLIWLYLMWQAYQGVEYQIPYLGKFSKDLAEKNSF